MRVMINALVSKEKTNNSQQMDAKDCETCAKQEIHSQKKG